MKSLLTSLLLAGMLFFVYPACAQLPKRTGMIGVSGAIFHFGLNDNVAGPYLYVQPEIGFFIGNHFAIGPYINVSSIVYNGSPYPAYGLGVFMRIVHENLFFQFSYDSGLAGDDVYEYSKIAIAAGYSIFMTKSFALEPQLLYAAHNEKGDSFDFDGLGIGLTLQFYFIKNATTE